MLVAGGAMQPSWPDALAKMARPWHDCRVVEASGVTGTLAALPPTDLLVDGRGLEPEPAVPFQRPPALPVLALSVPAGIHPETGGLLQAAVAPVDTTLALGGIASGLLMGEGLAARGHLECDDLGLARAAREGLPVAADRMGRPRVWPERKLTRHKGSAGRVLVIGGAPGMGGAVRLAGEAALAVGAGRVVVGAHESQRGLVGQSAELMVLDAEQLPDAAFEGAIVAIGSGTEIGAWASKQWRRAAARDVPLVVDGGALRLLGARPVRHSQWILTPHPGEAAALLRCSVEEIQTDRWRAAERIVRQFGGVCVLKGAGTVVAAADRRPRVCDLAVPALAIAGSGDVLAGAVAGFWAQGLDPFDAATLAVWAHANAGLALEQRGSAGHPASALLPWLQMFASSGP